MRLRIFVSHADVAELADAQVSEACDGDIVEVQVLSSAPIFNTQNWKFSKSAETPGLESETRNFSGCYGASRPCAGSIWLLNGD